MLTSIIPAIFQNHWLPILSVLLLSLGLYYRRHQGTIFPEDLPLIREKSGQKRFSLWTRLSFYFDCSALDHDVWQNFSKKGKAVLVPTLGTRKEIFLPHSSLKWVLSQPPNVLGMWEAFNEMFQLGHSLGDDKYMTDTWPHLLARHVLTQELDDYIIPVHEELRFAIDARLGKDTENWTTVDLQETMRMIINQAGSRFAVGEPLCRDEEYLKTVVQTVDSVVANAGVTGLLPAFLRPILGPIICWSTQGHLAKLEAKYTPILQKRISCMKESVDGSNDPIDLLQKMLRYAQKNRPEELVPGQMTRRLLMANLGFIYQAGFAMSNMLMNILASDQDYDTISVLRQEAEGFLQDYQNDVANLWTRQNSARMIYADSVARETLRLNTVPTRAVVRKVMVDGVKTDSGMPLPRDSLVSFVSQPMHTDSELFGNPETFDPFRFVRLRSQASNDSQNSSCSDAGGNWSPHSFLSTANLLIFGRGRNSCPGRFLVDIQLKMMLSYLLTNYDLKFPDEYRNQRPSARWVLEFMFPPGGAKLQIKRRQR